MKKVNLNRLKKIADHLESGEMMHKFFDFTTFNSEARDFTGCGTAGCAVGEFPAIWPDDWEFKKVPDQIIENYYTPRLKKTKGMSTGSKVVEDVKEWLSISDKEFMLLFVPYAEEPFRLTAFATKEQVAANIRKFIKIKENEHSIVT